MIGIKMHISSKSSFICVVVDYAAVWTQEFQRIVFVVTPCRPRLYVAGRKKHHLWPSVAVALGRAFSVARHGAGQYVEDLTAAGELADR